MSNGKSERAKSFLVKVITTIILIIASVLGINIYDTIEDDAITINNGETLVVTMIDVDQADCFLYEQNGKYALIDCGEAGTADEVIELLKKKGITKLDYLFGTHPHSDHMGGMYKIITNIDVGTIIIPEVDETKVTSTWYEVLRDEIESVYVDGEKAIQKYNVEKTKEGSVYQLGSATITVLEQFTEYKSDLNNYSAIMKISFGEIDIITTGDAEIVVEKEALKSGVNLDAEILKVGHHGSYTSTSDEFLDAISPDYVLISTGVDNKHEHPTKSVMEKFEEREIEVYRTDECGIVEVTITSDDITFNVEPGDYADGIEVAKRYEK